MLFKTSNLNKSILVRQYSIFKYSGVLNDSQKITIESNVILDFKIKLVCYN